MILVLCNVFQIKTSEGSSCNEMTLQLKNKAQWLITSVNKTPSTLLPLITPDVSTTASVVYTYYEEPGCCINAYLF